MLRKLLLLGVGVVVLLAVSARTFAADERKVVLLKNGSKYIGKVEPIDDGYRVETVIGATIMVLANDVESITDYVDPRVEYARRRQGLKADDAKGWSELGRWCETNDMLPEALDAFKKVLEIQPENLNAKLRAEIVAERIKKRQESAGSTGASRVSRADLMGENDIMRIRLEELRSSDRVNVTFQKDVIKRFFQTMRDQRNWDPKRDEAEFLRLRPTAQAVRILLERPFDEAIKKDILIRSDPGFMSTFKTRIWPVIQQNCAAGECHGGLESKGGLKLFNLATRSEAVMYTNFYILDQYRGTKGKMFDRDHPSKSLILQFGLPAEFATTPHPKTTAPRKPMYKDRDDRQYQRVYDWVYNLISPRPEYKVQYKVPGKVEKPTTPQPAAPDDGEQDKGVDPAAGG